MYYFTIVNPIGEIEALYTGRFAYTLDNPDVVAAFVEDAMEPHAPALADDYVLRHAAVFKRVLHEYIHSLLIRRLPSADLLNRLRFLARYYERMTVGHFRDQIGNYNVGDLCLYDLYFSMQQVYYERVLAEHEEITHFLQSMCFDEKPDGDLCLRSEFLPLHSLRSIVLHLDKYIQNGGMDALGRVISEVLEKQEEDLRIAFDNVAGTHDRFSTGWLGLRPRTFVNWVRDSMPINLLMSTFAKKQIGDFTFIAVLLDKETNEVSHANLSSGGIFNRIFNPVRRTPSTGNPIDLLKHLSTVCKVRAIRQLNPELHRPTGLDTDLAILHSKCISQLAIIRSSCSARKSEELRAYRTDRFCSLATFLHRFARLYEDDTSFPHLAEDRRYILEKNIFNRGAAPAMASESSRSVPLRYAEYEAAWSQSFKYLMGDLDESTQRPLFASLIRAYDQMRCGMVANHSDETSLPHEYTISKIRMLFSFFYMHGS